MGIGGLVASFVAGFFGGKVVIPAFALIHGGLVVRASILARVDLGIILIGRDRPGVGKRLGPVVGCGGQVVLLRFVRASGLVVLVGHGDLLAHPCGGERRCYPERANGESGS